MSTLTKTLLALVIILLPVSVSATFYRSIVLGNFEVEGTLIELGEDSVFVLFFHENEEFSFDSETDEIELIIKQAELLLTDSGRIMTYDLKESFNLAYSEL